MVPKLTPGGRDFDGAAAYYLADKAQPGRPRPLTAGRVAWAITRNLATDDPRDACRIMAATAQAQLALKAAAGVKATGRKLTKPVLAYSLSWSPTERPTRQEQEAAAEESLRALGLAHCQAVILAHTDAAHPHVHLIVNRIDPATGKAAPLSKSKLALSRWAQAYEMRQGRILCAERVENNARRAGTRPGRAADNRRPGLSRAEWQAGGLTRPDAAALRQQHAVLFSNQAGQERQGQRRRVAEAAALRREREASRRSEADRLRYRERLAAQPEQAEAWARSCAFLASERPADALAALTRDRSTFTRPELERFVGRHTPDAAAFAATMARLDAAPELIRVGTDSRGQARFTTRAHEALERRMVDTAGRLHRASHAKGDVPARFKGWSLSADQLAALHHVLAGNRLACVSGVAGTGKSTMLDAARQSWEAAGLRVRGLALAAEAAHSLALGSGIKDAGTIHSRLYQWEQGRNLPAPGEVIVVDEAGMAGSRLIERLLHFADKTGAKIVLVGQAQQLQAIEAGGAFRAIADRVGHAVLETVRRQKADWMKQATAELSAGQVAAALDRYEAAGMVHAHATAAAARAALIAAWDVERRANPGRTQIVMAFLRRDVAALNALARARLREDGALGPDVTVATATGPALFARGDRVAFQRNDTTMGVRNGSLGTIEALHGRTLTVRLDGTPARSLTFSLDDYAHIAHGYAATIHKSQGATVDRAHLLVSPNLDRHAAYVAMTRHRDRVDVHWSADTIPTRAKLAAILSRTNMKDTSLDYAEDQRQEHAGRHEAAEAMRERVRRRAAAFAEREQTPAGRMANAKSLLPASATVLQVARLAFDAAERARLFRHRQSTLRQWARRVTPAPLPAPPIVAKPAPAERRAVLAAHHRQTFDLWREMEDRHAGERQAERTARRILQREAAARWQAAGLKAAAVAFLARWSGYLVQQWQATHPETANDNRPGRPPPRGPRPL